MVREALYYDTLDAGLVRCRLCPALCRLKPAQRGICRCRFNDNGLLKTDNYGETVTIAFDPIEKKPLYHYRPGSVIASIGANGCNFSCSNCQNWQISQEKVETTYLDPSVLPQIGKRHGSIGLAYTYTEPLIWFEYLMDAAPAVRQAGLVNVLVSNGYINPEPLEQLLPWIDAFNIDLKGMRPEFYRQVCKGKLEPVLEVIRLVAASSSHLELTNLVIPDLNDTVDDFHKLGNFIASVDPGIPLHLSAYHPSHQMANPPTPTATLERAYRIMKTYVSHCFVGNMEIPGCSDSCCRSCGRVLIERSWYRVRSSGIDDRGACRECGTPSHIVLSP